MTKRHAVTVALGLAVVAAAPYARAEKFTWLEGGGHACKSKLPGDDVRASQFGVENNCDDCTKEVFCPIQLVKDDDLIWPGPTTLSEVQVTFWDAHPTQDVECRPILFEPGTGVTMGPIKKSSGTTNWASFSFADPYSARDLSWNQFSLSVSCKLPAKNAGVTSEIAQHKAVLTHWSH